MTAKPFMLRRGPIAVAFLLFFLIPSGSTSGGETDATAIADEDQLRIAREIQNVCFANYPPDLIEAMSGHEGSVPEEVRMDPARRQKFFRTEEIVMKGLFYPSLLDDLLPALTAVVRPGMTFLDLGSGDGRVVFMAAHLGADATGIEYDRTLHRIARSARRNLTDHIEPGRARLLRGDFFKLDFSSYDVLFYFGKGSFSEDRLLEKIRTEIRDDAFFLFSFPPGILPEMTPIGIYGPVSVYRFDEGSR